MTLDNALGKLRQMELPWEIHQPIRELLESVHKTAYQHGKAMGHEDACDIIHALVWRVQGHEQFDN